CQAKILCIEKSKCQNVKKYCKYEMGVKYIKEALNMWNLDIKHST
ncbi:26956_t:CDS:1, partial [Gigaspora margarita]